MAGVLPGGSPAEAQDPGPTFEVDPGTSWIGGGGWLPDAPIRVTFGDPADPDHSETFESGQGGWLWHHVDYDIEVGELVTVTDDVTTKSHTVVFVSVDVDQTTHTATGEADPDTTVRVQLIEWAHGPQTLHEEEVVADAEGAWSVDFAAAGAEVEGHHHVWASVVDADGDATRALWRVYYPTLTVSLSDNYIIGNDLAVRAPIEITIGDPVQFSDSTQTGGAGHFFREVDFDIQDGQLVTVTDGITTLEHLTFPLAITHIDVETDVVSGVGEPGVGVAVFVHAEPGPVRGVEVAADGTWSVDFSEEGDVEDRGWAFDIQPGTHIQAAQWEGDFHTSNASHYDATAGFRDVSAESVHAANVGLAAHHDITRGYPDGTYRPALSVRRDQMASFIVRTLEAAGHTLPTPEHAFTDIGGNTHEQAIGQLAAADIVRGRTPTSYAPDRTVTRDQMAAYLVRALAWAHESNPTAPASPFTDIAGNTHQEAIDVAYHLELTTGRTATTYAPRLDVRRDQMATFLIRLLGHLVDSAEPTPAVFGVVTDGETGAPVAGATIYYQDRPTEPPGQTTTDEDGAYAVVGLDVGDPSLFVYADGYMPKHATFAYDGTPVELDIALVPQTGLPDVSGTVTDAETGEPVEGAEVALFWEDADERWGSLPSDADGVYGLWGVDVDREFRLRVIGPSHIEEFPGWDAEVVEVTEVLVYQGGDTLIADIVLESP